MLTCIARSRRLVHYNTHSMLELTPRCFTMGSDIICSVKDPLSLLDIRLINMIPKRKKKANWSLEPTSFQFPCGTIFFFTSYHFKPCPSKHGCFGLNSSHDLNKAESLWMACDQAHNRHAQHTKRGNTRFMWLG